MVVVGVAVGVVVVVVVGVGVGVVVVVGVGVVVVVGVGVAVVLDMTEQQLTRMIIDAVNASGLAYVWRNQAGRVRIKGGWMQLAPEGTPDIVGYSTQRHAVGPGRFVGLEVKLDKGKLTREQQEFITYVPGLTFVVRSVAEAHAVLIGNPLREPASDKTRAALTAPALVGMLARRTK